jgi:hypothetical protein
MLTCLKWKLVTKTLEQGHNLWIKKQLYYIH